MAEGYDLFETCLIYSNEAKKCRGLLQTFCRVEGKCPFYKDKTKMSVDELLENEWVYRVRDE